MSEYIAPKMSRPPLTRQQQQRWAAAQKIGRRIEKMLADGYHVYDEDGGRVHAVEWQGFDEDSAGLTLRTSSSQFRVVYFDCDTSLDCGMHQTIASFKAVFADWTAIHPKHVKRIVR